MSGEERLPGERWRKVGMSESLKGEEVSEDVFNYFLKPSNELFDFLASNLSFLNFC